MQSDFEQLRVAPRPQISPPRSPAPSRFERNRQVERRNFVIEYRCAENQADRLPALAGDLVQGRVAVNIAPGVLPVIIDVVTGRD